MTNVTSSYHSDQTLISRLLARDRMALAEVYDLFGSALYGMIIRIIGSDHEKSAEDALKSTFEKLWYRSKELDGYEGSLFSFVMRIARQEARLYQNIILEQQPIVNTSGPPSLQYLLNKPHDQALKELLANISPESQEIVTLILVKGVSFDLVSKKLNKPVEEIRLLLRQALMQLK